MGFFTKFWTFRKILIIVLTPLLLLPLPLLTDTKEAQCAYTLFVVAVYWLTEAMPLAVTALIPALMFPLFGIMKSKTVASAYFKDFHLLLIGVVCLATSIEKWNLHKRIALRMVMLVGVNPGWLMMGFMISSAFLSMWLSNTSTAAMVMPIVEAVIQQILNAEAEVNAIQMKNMDGTSNLGLQLDEDEVKRENNTEAVSNGAEHNTVCKIEPEDMSPQRWGPKPEMEGKYISKKDHMMCKGMSLCIAYSCTIGGLSTITGTSTNLIFAEHFNNRYPDCQCINFGTWFVLTFPITIIILILSWVWLHWLYLGFDFSGMFRCTKDKSEKEKASVEIINNEYKQLGSISNQELVTLVIFILMALLWFTRDPGFVPGWSSLFPQYKGYATDSTAALILGLLFFIIPANMPTNSSCGKKSDLSYTTLITWKEFRSCMPWEIALLVGGGFALAQGTEDSGLSAWVGSKLTPLGSLPIWVTIAVSSLIVTSVTEVASNPATITIFLPILSPLAEAIGVNPLYILIPTTLCTSFAFLLPVANPPNAIVFTYGHLQVIDMVKAGLGVNIIGVLAVMLGVRVWGVPLFDLETYPSWAPPHFIANITGP
ncbi:solute carrier family 13 member 1 [Acipenser oxyrinchus oxyrinchus]|uniref:Solute carrier family 13 member 1 n=1 Tax=Acipenser oxyrinchus oxyrinchus TaxID=40147 RepID=A0AAD8DGS7_ACIOX|nr:solute carrier family 13 member 1 [Acipenser oxyrinchus oxyrinchus]